MSEEFQLPDMMDISPEAAAAAEATLDPNVKPPKSARSDKDKKDPSIIYYRWSEALVIEKAERKRTKTGLTEFFIQAKVRPGADPENENVGRRVFSRYRINFKVLNGNEKNPGHEIMNRLSLAALTSLLKSTAFLPEDAKSTGISAALLTHLFPAEVEPHESPLAGKLVIGNLFDRPNKGENAKYDRQTEVELWLGTE